MGELVLCVLIIMSLGVVIIEKIGGNDK